MARRADQDGVTTPVSSGISAPALRGHGIGVMVGALIGMGWLVYALRQLTAIPQILLGLAGSAICLWLLVRGSRLLAVARRLPTPNAATQGGNRRAWAWFLANFVAEVVLLNVAINLLADPSLHVYWLPAISLVVGLHFLPMAVIFAVPTYWGCGASMSVVAVVISALIYRDVSMAKPLTTAEAICNALTLWTTAGWKIRGT